MDKDEKNPTVEPDIQIFPESEAAEKNTVQEQTDLDSIVVNFKNETSPDDDSEEELVVNYEAYDAPEDELDYGKEAAANYSPVDYRIEDTYEDDDEDMETYEPQRKRSFASFVLWFVQSPVVRRLIIATSIAGILFVLQLRLLPTVWLGQERDMRMVSTEIGVNYDFEASAQFYSNDSRFYFFVTREGISFRGSNGALVWHNSFSFNRPHVSARGDFLAVSELERGRLIHVFDNEGPAFSTPFDRPVLNFNINSAGFLSVIVQYEGGYGIYLLSRERPTTTDPIFHWSVFRTDRDLVHPIFAEASDDGRYIVIAFVDLNTRVTTVVEFRYVNQWDAWGTEMGLFAAEMYSGLILGLRFMADNRLLVFTTEYIICFQLGPLHSQLAELWRIPLDNRIELVEFYRGSHFAVAFGERHIGTFGEGVSLGTVQIFNMNGVMTGSFHTGRRVTLLSMGHNAVIVGADRSFTAMDFRGMVLWEYVSIFDARDVIFLDDTSTILVAGPTRAEVFRRRRMRDDDRPTFDIGAF